MVPLLPYVAGFLLAQTSGQVMSPDGQLIATFSLDGNGVPHYSILRKGEIVLQESRLGLIREDGDFSKGLRLVSASKPSVVRDRYELLTSKRRRNDYRANRRVFHMRGPKGDLIITFQVSNDGLAFRYSFPERSAAVHKITEEVTSFRLPEGSRAWLQPMARAKTGFARTNPSYEENYLNDIPVGTPSPTGAGWVYPALFRTGETWVLVSEGTLSRNYCGTRLRSASPDGTYTIGFPDPKEGTNDGPVAPESTLPWQTPWRIVAVGTLKTIAESTLGTDVADKPKVRLGRSPKPGKASWSWPLLGDPSANFETQRRFIDYAAEMGWRYCLIDALWDVQIGYERMKELVDYARKKKVEILLWYNSNGTANDAPQTPKNRLTTHENRIAEFERLKAIGVAGLKVDFFGGDGQSTIAYYEDILDDSAPYGLLMNFHGATLPRGWQRKYPHLMTVEAIKGLEFITFDQRNADSAPSHAATIPFTRNVFDPMDFTPVVLDRINRIQRRTTSAFELALSVLFTSGIQHYAEIPEGMAKAPDYVRDFLKTVPSVWDDTKFLAGEPGKLAVFARKGDGRWYVAGINGEAKEKTITLELRELGMRGAGTLIADGGAGNLSFRKESILGDRLELTLPPNGGFTIRFEPR